MMFKWQKKKKDFVQLTKGYCKQNKTFLGNTAVTDNLGGGLRTNTNLRTVEGRTGRRLTQRGPAALAGYHLGQSRRAARASHSLGQWSASG